MTQYLTPLKYQSFEKSKKEKEKKKGLAFDPDESIM
jgi:hypothetical protein